MSIHSIDELRRQYERAKSKADSAKEEQVAAKNRLHTALCEATGMMGKTIESKGGFKIVVHQIDFFSDGTVFFYRGFQIKKDGSVGSRERDIIPSSLVPA